MSSEQETFLDISKLEALVNPAELGRWCNVTNAGAEVDVAGRVMIARSLVDIKDERMRTLVVHNALLHLSFRGARHEISTELGRVICSLHPEQRIQLLQDVLTQDGWRSHARRAVLPAIDMIKDDVLREKMIRAALSRDRDTLFWFDAGGRVAWAEEDDDQDYDPDYDQSDHSEYDYPPVYLQDYIVGIRDPERKKNLIREIAGQKESELHRGPMFHHLDGRERMMIVGRLAATLPDEDKSEFLLVLEGKRRQSSELFGYTALSEPEADLIVSYQDARFYKNALAKLEDLVKRGYRHPLPVEGLFKGLKYAKDRDELVGFLKRLNTLLRGCLPACIRAFTAIGFRVDQRYNIRDEFRDFFVYGFPTLFEMGHCVGLSQMSADQAIEGGTHWLFHEKAFRGYSLSVLHGINEGHREYGFFRDHEKVKSIPLIMEGNFAAGLMRAIAEADLHDDAKFHLAQTLLRRVETPVGFKGPRLANGIPSHLVHQELMGVYASMSNKNRGEGLICETLQAAKMGDIIGASLALDNFDTVDQRIIIESIIRALKEKGPSRATRPEKLPGEVREHLAVSLLRALESVLDNNLVGTTLLKMPLTDMEGRKVARGLVARLEKGDQTSREQAKRIEKLSWYRGKKK